MKFISSSYDKETGISTVTMQHLGVKFKGAAKVHPEEKETASEFIGCHYAEQRATISALKYELELAKNDAKICQNFVKSLECYSKFNKKEESAKSVYKQLNIKLKKVKDLTTAINNLKYYLSKDIENNYHLFKYIKKIKESKKDIENNYHLSKYI